jgi:protein involved in polysaccharide export with SLBB domain
MRELLSLLLVLVCALEVGAAELGLPREGYRIGPNDVIRIQVFGEDDLTMESRVSGEGKINYPLLGMLQVEGRTTEELQQELTERLGSGFVRLPKVSVSIVRHRNFYVSGEVKTPGGYPYEEGLTIQKALVMSGGLTEKAERGEFKVLRRTNGQEKSLPVKLETPVLPDDIIVAAEGQRFYVSGEVKTPGRYLYEKGLTVQKAISMSGDMTEKADKREIKMIRVANGVAVTSAVGLNIPVQPDDFIVIERLQKVYVDGEIKKPGDYSYEKGITVHKVITLAGGFTDKAAESQTRVLRVIDGQQQSIRMKLEDSVLPEDIIVVPRRFF